MAKDRITSGSRQLVEKVDGQAGGQGGGCGDEWWRWQQERVVSESDEDLLATNDGSFDDDAYIAIVA